MDFETFYSNVRNKVINLLKEGELKEGTLDINHIMNEVMKESIIQDLGLKRKVIKRYGELDKNVLYRDDSKEKFK